MASGVVLTAWWVYVLTTLLWCTDAIATGALFDVYMSDLARKQGYTHPNELIGILESTRGLTCVVAAVPLGYLSDRFDRLRVLRAVSCSFGLLGAFVLAISILSEHLEWAIFGLGLYAVHLQAASGALDVLLADALPKDKRTQAYAWQRTLQTSSRALGPFLQALLLSLPGLAVDRLLVSGFFGLVAFVLILMPLSSPGVEDTASQALQANNEGDLHDKVLGIPKHILVPGLVLTFTSCVAIGGGMSLKFFPLFYHLEYGLSDMQICWIMGGYWLMSALGSSLAARAARSCRRTRAVMGFTVSGITMLFLFVLIQPLGWNLLVFELRTMLINAHTGLNMALSMEYALPRLRGRWAALGSLNRASFAGSAVMGGVLTDSLGYRGAFSVTGCILSFATLLYSPLLVIVRHT
ncbi:unnamed protein product [Effrenium voratum]|nr:unnamed protein product [Effrenium voratum]